MSPLLFAAALAAEPVGTPPAVDALEQGLGQLRQGALPQGIGPLTRATRERPEDPATWLTLAWAWNELGDGEAAREALAGLAALGVEGPVFHRELGISYYVDGEPERALAHLDRVMPDDARGHLYRGLARRAAGDTTGAAADLESALADPAWQRAAQKEKARTDMLYSAVPEALTLRGIAGLAYAFNPAYDPGGAGYNRGDAALLLHLDAAWPLARQGDASLVLNGGVDQALHFANGSVLPTDLNLGLALRGGLGAGEAVLAPELRHHRWPDHALFSELVVPFEHRVDTEAGQTLSRGHARLVGGYDAGDARDRYSGLSGRWGYGVARTWRGVDVEAVGIAEADLTWGASRRFVGLGADLRADATLPLDLSTTVAWRVVGGVHPWADTGLDARRLELMHQASAWMDWPVMEGQSARLRWDLDTRQSSIPQRYGYGSSTFGLYYVAEL